MLVHAQCLCGAVLLHGPVKCTRCVRRRAGQSLAGVLVLNDFVLAVIEKTFWRHLGQRFAEQPPERAAVRGVRLLLVLR